VNNLHTITLYK